MPRVRGRKQGQTGNFAPHETVSVTVRFPPGDPARPYYEELVKRLDVSGAEAARRAIKVLAELTRTEQAAAEGGLMAS